MYIKNLESMVYNLMFRGLGFRKNRLVIKSFFRRRPAAVGSKLVLTLEFIIQILIENLNFYITKLSTKLPPIDSFGAYTYIPRCLESTSKYLLGGATVLLTLHSKVHYFCSLDSTTEKRIYTVLLQSLCCIHGSTLYLLNGLLTLKYLYILRIRRIQLMNLYFFWTRGSAFIPGRTSLSTFLRSPHSDKRSRTQFAKKTYKSVLKLPCFLFSTKSPIIKVFLGQESHAAVELKAVDMH